jgi:Raf kinase inhibitor-like YbhB/YbcL family protein
MNLTSSAFNNGALIPQKYACDGERINPPLTFSNIPAGTKSLVLIMEDPDVPKYFRADGIFDHWLIWNIPPTSKGVKEGSIPEGVVGLNTRGTLEYAPPCPPDKEHRYFFYLYALDSTIQLEKTSNKKDLLKAIEGKIIDKVELMGRYERQNETN